jgi:hypothetical protein
MMDPNLNNLPMLKKHMEVGHQRFFKDDSNDSTTYNEKCFRKWFTMRRGLFLCFMDLIYALDLFFIQKLGFVGTLGLSYIRNYCTTSMNKASMMMLLMNITN